jgi:hypothetical protein
MKTLNIPLEEKEHKALSKVKGKQSWRDFLFQLIDYEENNEKKARKLESLALKRYFDGLDNPAGFLMDHLRPEEYEKWSKLIEELQEDE